MTALVRASWGAAVLRPYNTWAAPVQRPYNGVACVRAVESAGELVLLYGVLAAGYAAAGFAWDYFGGFTGRACVGDWCGTWGGDGGIAEVGAAGY